MPIAADPFARRLGTKPPSEPQPRSMTRAGAGGSQLRTNGHIAATHRSLAVIS
jgi:hypothetical protein